jgi:hypothetical protein
MQREMQMKTADQRMHGEDSQDITPSSRSPLYRGRPVPRDRDVELMPRLAGVR